MNFIKKAISFLLCATLIAGVAIGMIGCEDADQQESTTQEPQDSQTPTFSDGSELLGTGHKLIGFRAIGLDGTTIAYQIHTDKTTVGEALAEVGLLEYSRTEYGLVIQSAGGITADSSLVYWRFCINGEELESDVDQTEITDPQIYYFILTPINE